LTTSPINIADKDWLNKDLEETELKDLIKIIQFFLLAEDDKPHPLEW
jgi:hypothetical protein